MGANSSTNSGSSQKSVKSDKSDSAILIDHSDDDNGVVEVETFDTEVEPGRVLTMPKDGTGLVVLDPWLEPFKGALRER